MRSPENRQRTLHTGSAPDSRAPVVAERNEIAGDGTVLVRDSGFREDDWTRGFVQWSGTDDLAELKGGVALDVENAALAEEIAPAFGRIALIRITFPSHTDGRGFSLARHLRLLGFRGRLRAAGHLLADQYAMARRNGFDEVEIDRSIAERQPEEQWLFRANWRKHDYQERLRRQRRSCFDAPS